MSHSDVPASKQVFRIDFLTEGDPEKERRSYVYAENRGEAIARLKDRFAGTNVSIKSITEEYGSFVVGADEVRFFPQK